MALTLNSTGVVIVDDTDPNILYQPPSGWERNGVSQEHLGTTHGGHSLAATATYRFNGTAVAVYGTVMPGALSNYVVDDAPPVFYNSPNPNIVSSTFHTLFYQSPVLSDGPHRLVITCLVNSSDNTVWFDYLVYQPSGTANSSAPSHAHTPSSTSAAPRGVGNKNTNLIAIVGGILGALLLIVLLFLLLLYKRLRLRPSSKEKIVIDPQPNWHIEPYSSPQPSSLPVATQKQPSRVSPGPNHVSSSSSGSALEDSRQHQDSGVRLKERPHVLPPIPSNIVPSAYSSASVTGPSSKSSRGQASNDVTASTATPPAYSYRPD